MAVLSNATIDQIAAELTKREIEFMLIVSNAQTQSFDVFSPDCIGGTMNAATSETFQSIRDHLNHLEIQQP